MRTNFPVSGSFDDFLDNKSYQKYGKYRQNEAARVVFSLLCNRGESLYSATINHKKPALQGVIVELEAFLQKEHIASDRTKDSKFFITMIGAMVRYILAHFGLSHVRTGVPLRHNQIIRTASTYELRENP